MNIQTLSSLVVGTALLSIASLAQADGETHRVWQNQKHFLVGLDEDAARNISAEEADAMAGGELVVKRGDAVMFYNVDDTGHNVFVPQSFNFIQKQGARTLRKMNEAGTFEVRCAIHPKMKMTIEVQE